jgi:hypothetical protein
MAQPPKPILGAQKGSEHPPFTSPRCDGSHDQRASFGIPSTADDHAYDEGWIPAKLLKMNCRGSQTQAMLRRKV